MYTYICIHAYMYICIYIYTISFTQTRVFIHTHTHTHTKHLYTNPSSTTNRAKRKKNTFTSIKKNKTPVHKSISHDGSCPRNLSFFLRSPISYTPSCPKRLLVTGKDSQKSAAHCFMYSQLCTAVYVVHLFTPVHMGYAEFSV